MTFALGSKNRPENLAKKILIVKNYFRHAAKKAKNISRGYISINLFISADPLLSVIIVFSFCFFFISF